MEIIRSGPPSFQLDEFMGRRLFAHLATSTRSGPRDTPVWFLWEEGYVWIISVNTGDTFPMKIREHPGCAIGIVDFRPAVGLVQHVGIRGEGELLPYCEARARRLLVKYLGDDLSTWDERFRRSFVTTSGILVRVKPVSVVLRDQSFKI